MTRRLGVIAIALVLAAACAGGDDDAGSGARSEATTTAPADASTTTTAATVVELYPDHTGQQYAGTANWICHPDLATEPCDDIGTTEVAPDGTRTVLDIEPAADPAFDCFYVYPTTSGDPGVNSDLTPDATEINTVIAQVARYSSVCRVFAPVYRSITLAGLGQGAFGAEAREMAYGDVVDAWRTYADELGDGRGVVLIGHSQGAGILQRLIQEEIGPDPDAVARIVSAVLLGTSVGELPNLPPCTSADEAGCVISYSSYPADHPPAEGSLFGRVRDGGAPALCVDPVALAGGNGLADAIIPVGATLLGGGVGPFPEIDTPFVRLPGALRTACTEAGGYGFLGVSLTGGDDTRSLGGLVTELLGPTWGLHLLDGNLAQDDLIEVVTRQAAAWTAG